MMRFQVCRTSWGSGVSPDSPCVGAVPVEGRDTSGKSFTFWAIDLPDLKALMAFVRENEPVIVGQGALPSLEIYDDYRE